MDTLLNRKWAMALAVVHMLVVLASVVPSSHCLLHSHLLSDDHGETVYVRHERSIHRRSANGHPDEIHVSFTAQDQPIKLRLKRHELSDSELPVYVLENDEMVPMEIDQKQRLSFYQDLNYGGAFAFTRNLNNLSRPFDLEGTMFIKGNQYLMSPHNEMLPMNGENMAAHTLKRLNTKINFGSDAIAIKDPQEKDARTQWEERRRLRRSGKLNLRQKRQAKEQVDTRYVELAFLTDYPLWEKFLKFANNDPDQAYINIRDYYIFTGVMMDIRFQTLKEIDPSLNIRIVPTSLKVAKWRNESNWTENNRIYQNSRSVHSESSLAALKYWVQMKGSKHAADHTMLFTGYDLAFGTVGIAYPGKACTDSSVSVIEEEFHGNTALTATHELAHSLNALHDEQYQDCNYYNYKYMIMAANVGFPTNEGDVSKPWQFSPCSVKAIGAFLKSERSHCLGNYPKTWLSKPASHTYDADWQCRKVMGPDSYLCRGQHVILGYSSMCRRLHCFEPKSGTCGSTAIVALEHTTCGDQKWCHEGKCVSDPQAPVSKDNCPQGDHPTLDCQKEDCTYRIIKDILCCATCSAGSPATTTMEKPAAANNRGGVSCIN